MAFPPRALRRARSRRRGIGVEAMDSRAAARTWGLLRGEGRWIAAALDAALARPSAARGASSELGAVPLPAEPLRRLRAPPPGRAGRRAARAPRRRSPPGSRGTRRPASGRSIASRAPPTSLVTTGVPQASASTQTLASPSDTRRQHHDVGGGEQAGQLVVRPGAEEADPRRDAEPLASRSSRARSGPSPTRIRVASGQLRQRLDGEILALARDQRAGA